MYRYCKAELHIDLVAVAKGQERLRRCVSQHVFVRKSWIDWATDGPSVFFSHCKTEALPYLSIQNKKQTSADLSVMIGRDDNRLKKAISFVQL